ncbi:Ornithine decarboxylase [Entomophthora muscae]|uniref:Ornithine decarboxylase n=1 Tax=Entomophthora muscae TaxID=34485 RepID=A0ACC2T563_9FUNG|nr:Ornithine decarboxylase [Entomophthora muscae]
MGHPISPSVYLQNNPMLSELNSNGSREAYDALSKRILTENQQDAFFICDLSEVKSLFQEWRETLPTVWPYYAVKCNPDLRVVSALAKCGAGFDCATLSEMQLVLGLGVAPSRIIFANPCKMESHLLFAKRNHIRRMTVDSVEEVEKVHSIYPTAELVVRIATDDGGSNFKLSNKFGACPSRVPKILESCRHKGLSVVGVSFHVGSGCGDLMAYKKAIHDADKAFTMARKLGFKPTLLDIGGGFNGRNSESKASLETFAAIIHESLEECFSKYEDLQVISEPGRYFVSSGFTLAAQIYSKRRASESWEMMYYLNEGIYGCLNGTLYGEEPPKFQLFR